MEAFFGACPARRNRAANDVVSGAVRERSRIEGGRHIFSP
jgi:hypothetical protein